LVKPVAIASASVVLWVVGPLLFRCVFDGLSAAYAYAIIATWVTTAFAALLPPREWRAVPVTIILYALMFCTGAGIGYEGLYHDIGGVPWPHLVEIALTQALFAASSLVFAYSFDAFRDRIRKWTLTWST